MSANKRMIALILALGFVPEVPLGPVEVNLGGCVIPLGLSLYLFVRADSPWERVRSLLAALATGAAVWALMRFLPDEPATVLANPNWLYGLSAALVAWLLGRSRRCAYIGGTLGGPLEGRMELMDIKGYTKTFTSAVENDDLDLQLVWLKAMYDVGPDALNSKVLGEYWRECVGPQWNEYGVCKGNLSGGIIPPMSGELNNGAWKHSNGAWIRTEVWACTNPGCVEKAIRLAFEDASVDHGFGEGSYAAIFVAAMESAAFLIDDVNALIDIGLSKIPEDCLVSKLVRLVKKAYSDGLDWKSARELVVENNTLGWFQAPNNIAFAVIGLLWGGCDFKKSMIIAVDCGDDTDCTAATVGALLGIMHGTAGIPDDWRGYIGDGIKSICITNGHGRFPQDCNELTDCLMNLLPVTLRKDHEKLMKGESTLSLGETTDLSDIRAEDFYGRKFVETFAGRKPYSYTIEGIYSDVLVEFDQEPRIAPNGELTGRITLKTHTMPEQKHYRLRFLLPDGWTAEYEKNLFTPSIFSKYQESAVTTFRITAGENVEAVNRLIVEVVCAGRPTPILVPMQIMG